MKKTKRKLIEGVDYGAIWGMSGIQNLDGKGYWYHPFLKPFGGDLGPLTKVMKTTTWDARPGNMELNSRLQPIEWFPDCIYIDWVNEIVINNVSLSGPGAVALFERGTFFEETKPFQFSFMSLADTKEKRLREWRNYLLLIRGYLQKNKFKTVFSIQRNETCPNTGHENPALEEIEEAIAIFEEILWGDYDVSLILKVSIQTSPEIVSRLDKINAVGGFCCSNTIKVGDMPHLIDWKALLPPDGESPLSDRKLNVPGPGGLSGAPLKPLVLDWIREAKLLGVKKHLNGGGGILYPEDVIEFKKAGADSVSLGSAIILRPWNVSKIIEEANRIFV